MREVLQTRAGRGLQLTLVTAVMAECAVNMEIMGFREKCRRVSCSCFLLSENVNMLLEILVLESQG